MKEILQYLFKYNTLSYEEAKSIMLQIPKGVFNDAEITSFITVMMMRSISIDELRGFADALIEMAHKVDLGTDDLVDIVGTGGDGKNTFNISTLACFVVAGAGQKVAKHGNYGSSSISGSSNVVQHMGYEFTNDENLLKRQLEEANICFMHAPKFHPSLGKVAPIRKNLGFRSFFNMLGPLVNPAKPKHSMLGVFSTEMGRIYNYLLQEREEHFMIVHSLEGYDEISLTGESMVITEKGVQLFNPKELLSQKVMPEELYGGDTTEKASEIFRNILSGKGTKAQNEVVITNASLALENTAKFGDFKTCRELAEDSLMSGKALQCLETLVNLK
ncbi:anthranilate phosphoribosyltransferase [Weeksellaceae bacterium TAE3-ERU29]|nr:anthranilate phosphoribosyltransferase [Weeksellaceae bacterium TAE3-ERU29]